LVCRYHWPLISHRGIKSYEHKTMDLSILLSDWQLILLLYYNDQTINDQTSDWQLILLLYYNDQTLPVEAPECPCTDISWSSDHLYRYDRTPVSGSSVSVTDLPPALLPPTTTYNGNALVKLNQLKQWGNTLTSYNNIQWKCVTEKQWGNTSIKRLIISPAKIP
jgi:hypothetical protein